MKLKKKSDVMSKYPCIDHLHTALRLIDINNDIEAAHNEICWAILKSGEKLTPLEQATFDRYNEKLLFDRLVERRIK